MASKILNKLLPFFLSPTLPALPTASPAIFNTSAWPPSSIITRDICIIGGGSTGTYSAIRLSDSNNTVVVIEADPRLGGHTNTYTDPATNETVDYGVVSFHNTTIVKDYFARFDIPLATASFALPGQVNEYVDFRTGQTVPGNVPANYSAALAAYGAQLAKYPYLETGFDLPYPVPADLLLPFGDFVTKYNLQAAVGFLFQFAQGLGNLLEQPTLYVFKNFGQGILQGLRTGFLTTARHHNGELYARALATLGANNVLLQSRVIATDRSGAGAGAGVVKVVVQTPQGPKLVLANKLLLTIPPKPDNLAGFDLSANESALFAQFANSAYYTALIRDPAIPPNHSYTNAAAANNSSTAYGLPPLPALYALNPTRVPGLFDVKVGAVSAMADADVKSLIVESVVRLKGKGANTTEPAFAAYESHAPFELTVSREAIENGFYRGLGGLQGGRGTWFSGAAFHTQDSSLLWAFTEGLLGGLGG